MSACSAALVWQIESWIRAVRNHEFTMAVTTSVGYAMYRDFARTSAWYRADVVIIDRLCRRVKRSANNNNNNDNRGIRRRKNVDSHYTGRHTAYDTPGTLTLRAECQSARMSKMTEWTK